MSKETSSKTWSPPGGAIAWSIWAIAAFFYLYEFAVRVAPSVMVEELQASFSVSTTQIAGALAAYYYIYSPLQILVGVLFDRFGGKTLLIPASLIVACGCMLASVSEGSLLTLTCARLLMGFGSAFGFVGVLYLASVWFPHSKLALISGLTTALGVLGAILSEASLSHYVDELGWDYSWIWFCAIGIATAALMFWAIPKAPKWEIERRKAHFSNTGISHILDSLIVIMKNPQSWVIAFICGTMYLSLSVFADQWGVQSIMKISGLSKIKATQAVSMVYFGWLIGAPIAGYISDRIGNRKLPLLIGSAVSCASFAALSLWDGPSTTMLFTILFIAGLGSSSQVITFIANMELNPNFARGTAVAFTNMVPMLIGGFIQHFFGFILDYTEASALLGANTNYQLALMLVPALMLLGVITCLFMKETFLCDEEETKAFL